MTPGTPSFGGPTPIASDEAHDGSGAFLPAAQHTLIARIDARQPYGIRCDSGAALFRPANTARGNGMRGFAPMPMSRRAVQKLVEGYVRRLNLDPNVTVHSFRVTALTTARDAECDIIDLQDFAGHADPRTTRLYDRRQKQVTRNTVERISI